MVGGAGGIVRLFIRMPGIWTITHIIRDLVSWGSYLKIEGGV